MNAPLPWKVCGDGKTHASGIIDANGEFVFYNDTANDLETLEFVVRAVNNHARLVAALARDAIVQATVQT